MVDLQTLSRSLSETDRKRAIVEIAKNADTEALSVLFNLAESDDSVEVRYFARKAVSLVKRKLRLQIVDARIEDFKLSRFDAYLNESVETRLALMQHVIDENLDVALPAMIRHLRREKDTQVLSTMLLVIGKFGGEDEMNRIIPFLEHGSPRVRANAIAALELIGSSKAYVHIMPKLEDGDNRVKANAIKAIKKLNNINKIRTLRTMVDSDLASMQASGAFVLQFFPSAEHVKWLARLLGSTDRTVRNHAILTLKSYRRRGVPGAEEILVKAGRSPRVIDESIAGLKRQLSAEVDIDAFRRDLASDDPAERIRAVKSAIEKGGGDTGEFLVMTLKVERDPKVIATLIMALGAILFEPALPLLVKCLEIRNCRCRANAIEAIRKFNRRDETRRIIPLLQDPNNRVRANAIVALKDETDIDVLMPLTEMVRSDGEAMQRSALYVIHEIASEAFYPLLFELAESCHSAVANAARENIRELESKGVRLPEVEDEPVPGVSKTLFPIEVDGKWGFIDISGRMAVKPKFDLAGDFHGDRVAVKIGKFWGFADRTGMVVIEPRFKRCSYFEEGLAPVKINSKWGYIDESGEVVIKAEYDRTHTFSEGRGGVRRGFKRGYVDRTGRVIVALDLDETSKYSEGLACVRRGRVFGYIDPLGKMVITVKTLRSAPKVEGGKVVVDLKMDPALPFSDGLAATLSGNRWGFVDVKGKQVIAAQFDAVQPFREEMAAACAGGKWGFIDRAGQWIIERRYVHVGSFSDGLAAVQFDSLYGYVNRDGEEVIPPRFTAAGPFVEGVARVTEERQTIFIDASGKRVWPKK